VTWHYDIFFIHRYAVTKYDFSILSYVARQQNIPTYIFFFFQRNNDKRTSDYDLGIIKITITNTYM